MSSCKCIHFEGRVRKVSDEGTAYYLYMCGERDGLTVECGRDNCEAYRKAMRDNES